MLLGAGTLLNVSSSLQRGQSAAQAAEFNMMAGDQNARLAEKQGLEDAAQIRLIARKNIGAGRAAIGASGITAESGSAMDVLQESAAMGEMDALRAKHSADMKAWSYRVGARQEMMQGEAARTAGTMGAVGGLFEGGAKIALNRK
jgi:hypothetical protein